MKNLYIGTAAFGGELNGALRGGKAIFGVSPWLRILIFHL